MPRYQYRKPPVHEVILDLKFSDQLADEELLEIGEVVGEHLGEPDRREQVQVIAGVSSTGSDVSSSSKFAGWDFKKMDPQWLLRLQHAQVSLHFKRSSDWPSGPYLGWEWFRTKYSDVFKFLAPAYGNLTVRRAGLRYLNRIAVPVDTRTEEWFGIDFPEPEPLGKLYSFDFQETWAVVAGYDQLSANVRLAKIKIPDDKLSEDHYGVLLDIDIFNLFVRDAPEFEETPTWFEEAHEAENLVFESCITDQLRDKFEPEEPQ